MIIEVRQTKANLKKEFEIYYDGKLQYTGKQTGISDRNPSWLLNQDRSRSVRFKSSENKKAYWRNRLSSWLFTLVVLVAWLGSGSFLFAMLVAVIYCLLSSLIPTVTKACDIFDGNEEKVASFRRLLKGLLTGYYSIEYGGREYRLYDLARSHYQYLSVYHDGAQIAQINKDLHTVNNRDNYTLFLLDEEAAMADLLAMFILYFDNYEYGDHGEAFVGYKKNWKWTWSLTDRFYDETWLSSHFDLSMAESSDYLEKTKKDRKTGYADKLVSLSYDQDLSGREEIVDKLYKLAVKKNKPEIWTQYAEGLISLSFKQNLSDIQKTVDKLYILAKQQNTPGVWRTYAEGLVGLSFKQDLSDMQKTVDKLYKLAVEQNISEIWIQYAEGLVSLSYKQDLSGIEKTVDNLYSLAVEQNTPEIWTLYAEGLVSLSYEQDLSDIEKTVEKLYTLAVEQNTPDVWTQYAEGLVSLSYEQDLSGTKKTVEKLYALTAEHNTPEIWTQYAEGLVSLSHGQDLSDRIKTVEKLHKLAVEHDTPEIREQYEKGLAKLS